MVREALRDSLAKQPTSRLSVRPTTAGTAFERARSLAPDVVVLDDSLPD